MISKLLEDLAADFWHSAGQDEPFPRKLEMAIFAKGLDILLMPNLCPQAIRKALKSRGFPLDFQTSERRLNGCLLAHNGRATIFAEEKLSVQDRNVILAHELGHYLAEYEAPRQCIQRRLGPSLFPVLDGKRQATVGEKLGATLAQVDLGVHVHFMDRTPTGTYTEPINQVEQTANDMALELIAPWRTVFAAMKTNGKLARRCGNVVADPARLFWVDWELGKSLRDPLGTGSAGPSDLF